MIFKKKMPITGTNTDMRPKPPVLSDTSATSLDAQKLIQQPPQPFANAKGAAKLPAASGSSGGVSTMEPKIASGLQHSNPGAKALPQGAPIGQKKMPNQSGQIGGRMGFPPPKRKAGQNGQGFPSKRNASFYGE